MHDGLSLPGSPPYVAGMTGDMQDTHNSIFFAAVSATRMPMIITDPNQDDNPIVFANPAFITMTGYSEKELVGHNCRFLQGPDSDKEVIKEIREGIKHRREVTVEILNYKKNGSSFWNALFISPVFDRQGNLIYFFASQLDVTKRKDTEEALHQSQKMEAVGQLTGGIAHDFNNLLTVIQGFGEILENNINKPVVNIERAKRAITAILQATEKGTKLTSQLLAFARKQKLQGRVVSMKDLIHQITPLVERSVGEGVHVEIEHHTPACNARIDPIQAELAIINIAVNARDAMNGKGLFKIVTGSTVIDSDTSIFGNVEHGHYTCLTMIDTGCGMDQETLHKITEPFFTTKNEGKGTGLGMSMVDGFVKQSGGCMAIESEVGKGTSVHMLFKCEHSDIEPEIIKAQKTPSIRKGDKETILVVEDKSDVAAYVEEMLIDFGYTVLMASSGAIALEVLAVYDTIDLMFSDIVMPGSMNGVQLAQKVKQDYPKVKILLTTGYTDLSIKITDTSGTPFHLIGKPYKRLDLTDRIRELIDGPNGIS